VVNVNLERSVWAPVIVMVVRPYCILQTWSQCPTTALLFWFFGFNEFMRDEWTLGFLCFPSEHAMPIYSERGGVCACVSGWWNTRHTALLMLVFLCSCVCFISGWIAAFYHALENNYNETFYFSSIYRVWPHFLIQNPRWHHHVDYKCV